MYAALLKHKWPLLAFLVITLAGVQMFIGNGYGNRTAPAQQELAVSNSGTSTADTALAVEESGEDMGDFYGGSESEDVEYVEEEELIDGAAGFDPTPEGEESFADEDDGGYGDPPTYSSDGGGYDAPANSGDDDVFVSPPIQEKRQPEPESYRG